MTSRRELLEAQRYLRRELSAAFLEGSSARRSGASPERGRPVLTGLGLMVVLTIAALVSGFAHPGLPREWDHDRLLVAKRTGARYVGVAGTLHPIVNATSARLLLPVGYRVVVVDDENLSSRPHGPAVGIAGAPESLPALSDADQRVWTACVQGPGVSDVRVDARPRVDNAPLHGALLIDADGELAVITGGQRYPIGRSARDATLRALDLDAMTISHVPAQWARLFPEGSPLAPPTVPHVGEPLSTALAWPPGITRVGTVIEVAALPDEIRRYVAVTAGIAPISDVAAALLQATTDVAREPVRVPAARLAALPTVAGPVAPTDWPTHLLAPLDIATPCAVLHVSADTEPRAALGGLHGSRRESDIGSDIDSVSDSDINSDINSDTDSHTKSDIGSAIKYDIKSDTAGGVGPGALVRVISKSAERPGRVLLVDDAGDAHELVGELSDLLDRLGYRGVRPVTVPESWADALPEGVAFSRSAASVGLRG